MISDDDMLFVARDCNLTNAQLNIFYLELGLTEAEIDAAKHKTAGAGIQSIYLQAVDVLRSWRLINADNATRMALIEAIDTCGYDTQVRTLEQEWDITLEGMCHNAKVRCQICLTFSTLFQVQRQNFDPISASSYF